LFCCPVALIRLGNEEARGHRDPVKSHLAQLALLGFENAAFLHHPQLQNDFVLLFLRSRNRSGGKAWGQNQPPALFPAGAPQRRVSRLFQTLALLAGGARVLGTGGSSHGGGLGGAWRRRTGEGSAVFCSYFSSGGPAGFANLLPRSGTELKMPLATPCARTHPHVPAPRAVRDR